MKLQNLGIFKDVDLLIDTSSGNLKTLLHNIALFV